MKELGVRAKTSRTYPSRTVSMSKLKAHGFSYTEISSQQGGQMKCILFYDKPIKTNFSDTIFS